MREKQKRLIVTFHTTTAAMAMESYCRESGIPGRLIPTPRQITADCGLSWSAPPEAKTEVRKAVSEGSIDIDDIYQLEI